MEFDPVGSAQSIPDMIKNDTLIEVVKLHLTVPGIDVYAKNVGNNTSLIHASANGHHEVVKLLLAVPGIDVNAKDHWNNTALHWARTNELKKMMIDHGAV